MACPESYKPSPTLLKSSFVARGKEYPRVAALDGIAYVVDTRQPKAERIGWFICIVASTVATIGIILTLMERFQTDPMMNSLELRFTDKPLNLPRFYFCPPWEAFNPPKNYNLTLYKQLYQWDFVGSMQHKMTYPNDQTSLRSFFKEHAPSCEEFLHDLEFSGKKINCTSIEIKETTSGICFLIPSAGPFVDDTSVTFTFNANVLPMRIYAALGKETQFIRHLEFHYLVSPATITLELQETYTSPAASVLTRSQRQCFFPGEQAPYAECVLQCKIARSHEFCNCVPWFLAKPDTKECQISQYECLDKNSINIQDVSKCRCRLPCDHMVLKNTEIDVLSAREPSTIKIRERAPVKFTRSVRFGWTDLFVSFGGIAGLFLGCSILSIIEFSYYFSLRTYCGAVLSAPKHRRNITKINVLDAVHPVTNLTRDQKSLNPQKRMVTFYDYTN